jgi:hypothetical protein
LKATRCSKKTGGKQRKTPKLQALAIYYLTLYPYSVKP